MVTGKAFHARAAAAGNARSPTVDRLVDTGVDVDADQRRGSVTSAVQASISTRFV